MHGTAIVRGVGMGGVLAALLVGCYRSDTTQSVVVPYEGEIVDRDVQLAPGDPPPRLLIRTPPREKSKGEYPPSTHQPIDPSWRSRSPRADGRDNPCNWVPRGGPGRNEQSEAKPPDINVECVAAIMPRVVLQLEHDGWSAPLVHLQQLCGLSPRGAGTTIGSALAVPDCLGTAFLVAPKVVVTAAHCVCPDNVRELCFVFDLYDDARLTNRCALAPESVYHGLKLLGATDDVRKSLNCDPEPPWTFVELDRPACVLYCVEGRPVSLPRAYPTTWCTSPRERARIYAVGHPLGTVMQCTQPGCIERFSQTDPNIFWARISTYQGHSGAPIFAVHGNALVGMLVGGLRDFVYNPLGPGFVAMHYPDWVPGGERCVVASSFMEELARFSEAKIEPVCEADREMVPQD